MAMNKSRLVSTFLWSTNLLTSLRIFL